MRLDILTFDALFESLTRIRNAENAEAMMMTHIAAQGDSKAVKEWIAAHWSDGTEAPTMGTAEDFKKKLGPKMGM